MWIAALLSFCDVLRESPRRVCLVLLVSEYTSPALGNTSSSVGLSSVAPRKGWLKAAHWVATHATSKGDLPTSFVLHPSTHELSGGR